MPSLRPAVGLKLVKKPYICPQCRHRTLHSPARRRFSSSESPRLLDGSLQTTSPHLASLGPVLHGGSTTASSTPFIRDHLRAWAVQNQKLKQEHAEQDFVSGGRLTVLPNSLFIEEVQTEQHDPDVEDYSSTFQDHHDHEPGPLSLHSKLGLEVGSLVYWTSGSPFVAVRPQYAIYLGFRHNQERLFLADGRWLVIAEKPVFVGPVIQGFIPREETDAILKYFPKKLLEYKDRDFDMTRLQNFADHVPHADAAPLQRRIVDFSNAVAAYRRDNLALLDNVYEKFAQDQNYTTLSFSDVTGKLFGRSPAEVPAVDTMALFFAMTRDGARIKFHKPLGSETSVVIFIPKHLQSRFEEVVAWSREYQEAAARASLGKSVVSDLEKNPLTAFIDKARRLILRSRKLRSPTTTGQLGPSSSPKSDGGGPVTQNTGETFTDSDKMILEFLWDCYVREPHDPTTRQSHHAIGSLILRAVGAYPKMRLERKIGSLLLQELGVLSPWAQFHDHDITLGLPGRKGSEDIDRLVDEANHVCELEGWTPDFTYDQTRDTLASFRQQFEHEAFAVDSMETIIRDDAFSIEPNTAITGSNWVHIHIAHPSAFISPDHVFSRLAQTVKHTKYLTETALHMFPVDFARAMSLKSGSPALTISTLLSDDGTVLDVKLQPTILQKVTILQPSVVDDVVDRPQQELAYMHIGREPKPVADQAPSTALAQTQRKALRELDRVLNTRHQARRREVVDPADWPYSLRLDTIQISNTGPFHKEHLSESVHYLGEPDIVFSSLRHATFLRMGEVNHYDDLTRKAMQLAAESAGKWFHDRKIPAHFLVSAMPPDVSLTTLNQSDKLARYHLPLVSLNSSPKPFIQLSVKQYLQCTSPLRKYHDLVAHWQADAYIKATSGFEISSATDMPTVPLPFTKKMLDEENSEGLYLIKSWTRSKKKLDKLWVLRGLFRAFHFNEAELPEVWDMVVDRVVPNKAEDDDTRIRGVLVPFGVTMRLLHSPEKWEISAKREQYLPVKFEVVDLGEGMISCRAVGPPSDTPTNTDPIRIVSRKAKVQSEEESR